ncbi:MAG: DUF3445 domain-containing protein [Planctomycetales bacterium]|nr:DUF3445 domain-containing protein [Planctomycetales bacterium]MBN8625139.1 DUF3445 domain-containing protein [Planctomycetota bacterium]
MPDWSRILPDADHRWTMGLRPGDAAEFFRPRDATGEVLRERRRWLADEPEKYVVATPECESCVDDSLAVAKSLGFALPNSDLKDLPTRAMVLGCAWESDFVWLLPDDGGTYHVVGGIVCFPSSWALTDKVGLPIGDVHAPVPGLNSALGRQIDTFLAKLEPGAAWTRENWSLSRSDERNQHTSRPRLPFDDSITADDVWIRLEHQLLLRLRPSSGVLFGIRIELVPLVEIRQDAEAARRLARALKTMSQEAAEYKILAPARERLIALL